MKILYLLIPLGFMVMGIALWAIIWAVKNGQFEDLEGPAHRILMDDDDPMVPGFDKGLEQPETADSDLNTKPE
ncbi:MAG: cbb3-type cytochrome oxidase assembly protein CcoS [Gammaproteobacteria bacterium]|nr:cbb3-type cytochrome oxidase assembly protein CcoS [Gammaproteobacteria bacterium]